MKIVVIIKVSITKQPMQTRLKVPTGFAFMIERITNNFSHLILTTVLWQNEDEPIGHLKDHRDSSLEKKERNRNMQYTISNVVKRALI